MSKVSSTTPCIACCFFMFPAVFLDFNIFTGKLRRFGLIVFIIFKVDWYSNIVLPYALLKLIISLF